MKKGLQIHYIAQHTPEWHKFRETGIGGSETGIILNLNKYDTAMRLFHEKIGTADPHPFDNEKMFWGRELEDKIAEIWAYWDDDKQGYVKNKAAGKLIRKASRVNGFIVNPKYPWLFASIDRKINKGTGINFITGELLTKECPLECKAISYWAASMWASGIPQHYLVQIQTYMIVMEVDYAELALLKDGNDFRVEYFQRDQALCDLIIEASKSFWYDRILPAKEAKLNRDLADLSGNYALAEEFDGIIQHLEPPPDTTEAYKIYMSDKFLHERDRVQGTFDLFELARRDEMIKKIINNLAATRRLHRNKMIDYLVENGAELIDFGDEGTVRWTHRRNAKSRVTVVNMKEKPMDYMIDREINKLNFDF